MNRLVKFSLTVVAAGTMFAIAGGLGGSTALALGFLWTLMGPDKT